MQENNLKYYYMFNVLLYWWSGIE